MDVSWSVCVHLLLFCYCRHAISHLKLQFKYQARNVWQSDCLSLIYLFTQERVSIFIHFHYVTTCISRGLIKVSERRCGSTLSLVGGMQTIKGISTLRQAHLRPLLSISNTLITSASHTHLKHISHSDLPDASLRSGALLTMMFADVFMLLQRVSFYCFSPLLCRLKKSE